MNDRVGVRGWLLVLCLLLLIWQPLSLALTASTVVDALAVRGLPLALMLALRLLVTAFGIAAGLALLSRRSGAVAIAKTSLVTAAAVDVFTYTTPYFPNTRLPGDTSILVVASLAYYAVWFGYLARSERVKNTYS